MMVSGIRKVFLIWGLFVLNLLIFSKVTAQEDIRKVYEETCDCLTENIGGQKLSLADTTFIDSISATCIELSCLKIKGYSAEKLNGRDYEYIQKTLIQECPSMWGVLQAIILNETKKEKADSVFYTEKDIEVISSWTCKCIENTNFSTSNRADTLVFICIRGMAMRYYGGENRFSRLRYTYGDHVVRSLSKEVFSDMMLNCKRLREVWNYPEPGHE